MHAFARHIALATSVFMLALAGCGGGSSGSPGNNNGGPPPPAVPAAPTGVSATPGNAQVTVAWPAVTGATSYNLYWSTTPGVTKASGTKMANATSGYVHSGLTNGTTYYYVLTAVNAGGESAASAPASAVPAVNPAPSAPTGVSASAGDAKVTVTWGAVSGATSYNVYWSTTPDVTKSNGTQVTGATRPWDHTGRTNGTTYYYVVTAVNANGESVDSAQVSATPIAAPAAPTGVVPTAGDGQVTLTWPAVSGATSYNLYRGTATNVTKSNGQQFAGVSSGVVQTGLTNGTTYYFVVTATNAGGESSESAEVNARPLPPVPAAPTNVQAIAGDAQVTVSWNTVAGATKYNVYRKAGSAPTTSSYDSKDANAPNPRNQTGLSNGTTYYFIVTAENLGGESVASSAKSATPAPAAGYSISGTVTGPAVEGVRIILKNGASVTIGDITVDSSGTFTFPGLAAGSYTLTPSLDGYSFSSATPATVTIGSANATKYFTQLSTVSSYAISGYLSYTGSHSPGRAYVWAMGPGCSHPGCAAAGTSVALSSGTPASYAMRGLPNGTYTVVAALDDIGFGVPNASEPRGQTPNVSVSGADATANVTLSDQVGQTPQAPDSIEAFPGPKSAFVMWDAPSSPIGEIASSYRLTWGTDTAATNGGNATVPAYDNPYKVVGNLTDGQDYYFKVYARIGATESAGVAVGPVKIGDVAGPSTVSGVVSGAASTSGALVVLLYSSNGVRLTRVENPSPSQAYSITGVPNGTYTMLVMHDRNSDGLLLGDPGHQQAVTVAGNTTVSPALSSAAYEASLRTHHWKSADGPGEGYNLVFEINDAMKTPVEATILSGKGLPLPLDLPRDWQFERWQGMASAPTVGDTYRVRLKYGDGSSETAILTVTGVLGSTAFAQNLVAQTTAPGTPAVPLFKWSEPTDAPAGYGYGVGVWGNGADWWYPASLAPAPSTTTSVLYYDAGGDGTPSQLGPGTYTWSVAVVDSNGNRAEVHKSYTVPAGGGSVDYSSTIQGTWAYCTQDVAGDLEEFWAFSGANITYSIYVSSTVDGTCGGPSTLDSSLSGTFTLGESVATTFGVGGPSITAQKIDFAVDGGLNFYDLVYIDTAATPDRLTFGDGSTGNAESDLTRPTAIDAGWYATK